MNRGKRIIAMLLAASLLTGCAPVASDGPAAQPENSAAQATQSTQPPVQKEVLTEGNLRDNDALYAGHDPYSVVDMYLTVSTGNETDSTNHTWQEVNTYSAYDYEAWGVDRYKVEGILQIDDGSGLGEGSFGYGEVVPNVSVQVRGQTSSRHSSKNYKIRIKDGKGEYNGQRTLALNKHLLDPYRFTNKLCYDLLTEIPELMAARTQFVRLHVKDTTGESPDEFVDYGIYTMVEQLNKTYLANHGLDNRGQFYKVNMFEWYPNPEIVAVGDDYDEAAFEKLLEIKGNDDHTKLREVIDKIHNYNIPITEIVEEHFNAENICYWMAFQILIGNYDTGARNLFLYSPQNSQRWYIISWDMDASFRRDIIEYKGRKDGGSWLQGMTQFVGLVLVNRMMKEAQYRQMLDDAIHDLLADQLEPEAVRERCLLYSAVLKEDLYTNPYSEHRNYTIEEYDGYVASMADQIWQNYGYYQESLLRPWPFFTNTPEEKDGKLFLSWGAAYDIRKETVTYNYQLATDYNFENVVASGEDLLVPSTETEMLPPGTYYLRVRATNESGYTGDSFDFISISRIGKIYACLRVDINEDGSIVRH